MKKRIFRIGAPAKINLYLKVLGERPDGYHEIETVFHPLPRLKDEIEIEILDATAKTIEISCDHPNVPENEDNICFKAAAGFAESARVEPSWKIRITKNIPVAAGLGGGSSDAAAILRLLNDNVRRLDERELRGIALAVGADVPFFLDPRPAVGRGLGERLEPVESSLDFSVLLVNPRFPVSAAWTYANLKRTPGIEEKSAETAKLAVLAALRSGDPAKLPETIHNDLAPALLLKFPLLRILLDALGDATLPPLSRGITGSGPTLFAVFADDDSTNAAAAKLADEYGDSLDIFLA